MQPAEDRGDPRCPGYRRTTHEQTYSRWCARPAGWVTKKGAPEWLRRIFAILPVCWLHACVGFTGRRLHPRVQWPPGAAPQKVDALPLADGALLNALQRNHMHRVYDSHMTCSLYGATPLFTLFNPILVRFQCLRWSSFLCVLPDPSEIVNVFHGHSSSSSSSSYIILSQQEIETRWRRFSVCARNVDLQDCKHGSCKSMRHIAAFLNALSCGSR